jgi:hypothetical protein
MKLKDCLLTDQIFTHIDPQGVVRHFNASAIWRALFRKDLLGKARVQDVQVTEDLVKFIESNHGIEREHIEKRLTAKDVEDIGVLLACFPDGTQCMIDGNHRFVKAHGLGHSTMRAVWIDPEGWEPYLVTDMPDELANLDAVRALKK